MTFGFRNTVAALAAAGALGLSGCAATVEYKQPATGSPSVRIPADAASRVVLNVQLDPPHAQDGDWARFRKEWVDIMEEQSKAKSVMFEPQDGTAEPTGEDGTLVVVHVHDYHYVTVGGRLMWGVMTGNAFIDAKVEFRDLKTGTLFGEREYNTTSSAWHGVFAAVTPKQLYQIADETLAQLGVR